MAGRAARMLAMVLVVAPALLMTACEDDATAPEITSPELIGTWAMTLMPGYAYVEVTGQTVTIYESDAAMSCYRVTAYTVVGVEDDTYEMEREGTGETSFMAVDILEEDTILVTHDGFTSEFVRWDGAVSALERCDPPAT